MWKSHTYRTKIQLFRLGSSVTVKHVFLTGFNCLKFSWRHKTTRRTKQQVVWSPSKDSLYCTILGWLMLARTATSLRDSCLSLHDICQNKRREVAAKPSVHDKRQLAWAPATRSACSHPGYANLLDDILASILFGFHEDRLPEGALADFLHLFVLVHVNTMAGSSCCVCTARNRASLRVICLISHRHRRLGLKQIMAFIEKGIDSDKIQQ